MGFYRDGKYIYEPTDLNGGTCDQETIDSQNRERQKKIDQDNTGIEDLTKGDKT